MKTLLQLGWRIRKGVAVLVLIVCFVWTAAASDTVTLGQTTLGNIFYSTQVVTIPVQTTGDTISWTATDFFGAVTSGTPIAVSNGSATIRPGLGRLGYFALNVTALRNGSAVATATTTFAVVTQMTVSAMSDSPFGVCTHFAANWNLELMQLIAKAGISQFRDEQLWQYIEPTLTSPPTYAAPSTYTSYMASAAQYGLNLSLELDFENPNYDGGYTPYDTTGYNGYANYGADVLAQYPPTSSTTPISSVEVWNEYNGSYYHAPSTLPAGFPSSQAVQYTAMLQAAYTAAKKQQSGITVVGGACVPIPLPWLTSLFNAGALNYLDAVDIHPYVAVPEGTETALAAVQQAMVNANSAIKPMWATECGSPDNVNPTGRQVMASYLVRLLTIMRTAGVTRTFWYLMRDEPGYSTGLLHGPTDPLGPYAPSSAYPAYSNLIQQLYGTTYVRREITDSRTRFYLFHRGTANTEVRVAWSTESTAQLVLTASSPLTFINIMGEATTVQPTNGLVPLAVDINPVYVIGTVTNVQEIGRDTLVADSVADFTQSHTLNDSTQSTTPGSWYYGYYDGTIPATTATTYPYTTIKPMTWTATSAENAWTGPYYALLTDGNGSEPSQRNTYDANNDYTQVWAVRRWQSNVAGTAHIVGSGGSSAVANAGQGDGVGFMIYVDGTQVFSQSIAPGGTFSFDLSATIQSGSDVDFVLTPGPGVDNNYDYTAYQAKISVPGAPPRTFSAWQGQHFTAAQFVNPAISGDSASPAGDGVPNLIKYAENLDPNVPNSAAFPKVGTLTSSGATYLTLSYRQATAPTDLTFATELNPGNLTTPSAWQTGGTLYGTPVDNGDGTKTVTYQDTTPMSKTAPDRFMRLRVTRTSQ